MEITKKKPFYKKWWFIVIVLIVLLSTIGKLNDNISNKNNSKTPSPQASDVIKEHNYVDDKIVNSFINSYNSIADSELTNISKGNIRTKYFADYKGFYLELIHPNATDAISVTISETNDTSENGVKGMDSTFKYVVKAIDPSLTDSTIDNFFQNITNGYQTSEYLGNLLVSFSPDTDQYRGHITIDAPKSK